MCWRVLSQHTEGRVLLHKPADHHPFSPFLRSKYLVKARCIYQVTCLIPTRLRRGAYLIFLQDDMGSLNLVQLGSAHSLRNTAERKEETLSRCRMLAGSSFRHSIASDTTPHRVRRDIFRRQKGSHTKEGFQDTRGSGAQELCIRKQAATSQLPRRYSGSLVETPRLPTGGTGKGVRDSGDHPHCCWGCETETSEVG